MSAKRPQRPPRGRQVVVHLPIENVTNALSLINVLDALIEALWRTHGGAIIELRTDLVTLAPARRAPARRASDHDVF